MSHYVYTGVAATEEHEREIRSAYRMPYIAPGGRPPPDPGETTHRIALTYGLPEIVGFYGYDFERHEFIRVPDATLAPPTAPAHARVLAALGQPNLRIVKHDGGRCSNEIRIEPRDDQQCAGLLAALTEYRASLVTHETKALAEVAIKSAHGADAAMREALEAIPDDMRKSLLQEHWPEQARWA